MGYRRIVVTRPGDLSGVDIQEAELRAPAAGEARVKVLASPVVQDDADRCRARKTGPPCRSSRSRRATPSWAPWTPPATESRRSSPATGWSRSWAPLRARRVRVREGRGAGPGSRAALDPAAASVLVLNYLVPARCCTGWPGEPGQTVLVIGASGGVGTAFFQLGELAGLGCLASR